MHRYVRGGSTNRADNAAATDYEVRKTMTRVSSAYSVLLVLSLIAAAPAGAQEKWPSKPISIMVPFPPGGAADTQARIIGKYLSARVGQPVIVENKSGAGGNIGAAQVAASAPDGYTLLMGTPGPLSYNKFLYPDMLFDPEKDFTPVSFVSRVALALAVNPKVMPVNSLEEFMKRAREANPPIAAGNGSTASASHMSIILLRQISGVKFTDVAYRGSAPLMTDLLGGHVPFTISEVASLLPHVKSGAIKALAVTTAKPWFALPGVPSLSQAAPGYEAVVWFAIVGPKGIPDAVLQTLRSNIDQVLAMPEVVKQFRDIGADPVGGSPAEQISSETRKWGEVIRKEGIKPK